ncbi:MAG: cytochrome c biogenesis protein ResB [Anaerolineae bacterium]|nr:cytochrome c biogenesis protein ResB [Anaerolineae bacterium]
MIRWISRPGVTAILLLLTMALLAVGTLFPQRPDDPVAAALWEKAAHLRYGSLKGALEWLGLFRWYTTPVPWVALAALAVVTFLCTANRWPTLWGRLRSCSAPHLGTLLTHLAVLLLLAGLAVDALGWREERTLTIGDTVTLAHFPQLSLRADDIRVLRYPDGTPADYEAEVTFFLGDRIERTSIRVNNPATFSGTRFLIVGYTQLDNRPFVTLLAVYDPGAPLWLIGGGMLLVGLGMTTLGLVAPAGVKEQSASPR